jgi:cysteine synthase A
VAETDTLRACHGLAGGGFLFGGSTGTVVSGALSWLKKHGTPNITAVAIAPDLGERYLSTVYDTDWVEDNYGVDVLGVPGFWPSTTSVPVEHLKTQARVR